MIVESPLSDASLQYVVDHLWERGREELRILGVTTEQAIAQCKALTKLGPRGEALIFDRPTVATGICDDGREVFSWFLATDEFHEHVTTITRYLRREMAKYPALRIYSACVHPDTAKWFRLLGFRPDGASGKLTVFVRR